MNETFHLYIWGVNAMDEREKTRKIQYCCYLMNKMSGLYSTQFCLVTDIQPLMIRITFMLTCE